MSTALLIGVKAINGGLFVALFAVLGELLQPKRFAGIFGASPAVALGNPTWVAVAVGGYLTLAAIVPSWRQDVRTLAFHRRDAARASRAA